MTADAAHAALAAVVKAGQRVTPQALVRAGLVQPLAAPAQVAGLMSELRDTAGDPTSQFIDAADGSLWRHRLAREECRLALVDLNNVVWTLNRSPDAAAEVVTALAGAGVERIVIVADATIEELGCDLSAARWSAAHERVVASRGTRADEILLERASSQPCIVVSNDQFRGYRNRPAWRRRIGVAQSGSGWRFDPAHALREITCLSGGGAGRGALDS